MVVLLGVLENTAPETVLSIKPKVTLLEGDLDPLAPAAAKEQIEKDLEAAGTDCEMTMFEYVAHAFTLPFMGFDTSICFA
ncbi:MAG: dienelactone hydrolase family protein [Pseudomonadota bacterium]